MYRRILVTLDGSTLARTALRQAALLVTNTDIDVILFQAVESPEESRWRAMAEAAEFAGVEGIDGIAERHRAIQREEAKKELARAERELRDAGVASVRTEVGEGLPGNAIIEAAQRNEVDAILMATRGHGGLGREILGSVAEYVVRHTGSVAVILVGPRTTV